LIVKVAGIVPPFGSEFWMREMILGKGKGSAWKSTIELFRMDRRWKMKDGVREKSKEESRNDENPYPQIVESQYHITLRLETYST
jgi:hypothetical protein